MESKREKFVRLAEARSNKIIDMIQLLGNCANKSTYEYTKDDVNHKRRVDISSFIVTVYDILFSH